MSALPNYEDLKKELGEEPTMDFICAVTGMTADTIRRHQYFPDDERRRLSRTYGGKIVSLVRTLERLDQVTRSKRTDVEIAFALAKLKSFSSTDIQFLGEFLKDVAEHMAFFEKDAQRKCAECGESINARSDAIHCSQKCRQKAYRKRSSRIILAPMGERTCNEASRVTHNAPHDPGNRNEGVAS
jgi:hypothetical protein